MVQFEVEDYFLKCTDLCRVNRKGFIIKFYLNLKMKKGNPENNSQKKNHFNTLVT